MERRWIIQVWIIATAGALVGLGCTDSELLQGPTSDDDDWSDDDDAGDDEYGGEFQGDDDDDSAAPADDEVCDEVPIDPTTLYLSADDSNSMASPALARQLIEQGSRIGGGMRPYEFLNYYDFYFPPAPAGHVRISPQVSLNQDGDYTLLIGVVAPSAADVGRRPRSLTFSVDSSGSMGGHAMAVAKDALTEIAHNLDEGDVVSVLSWDTGVTVLLEHETVDGPDDPDLLAAIDALSTGGSTDLHGGLVRAYQLAEASYDADRLNRVVLISDGGANVGVTDEELIATHADDADDEGIYMVGIGIDEHAADYNELLMDTITDAGKGAYVYLDSGAEAGAIFGDDERFVSVMEIAARAVQVEMVMPAGYVMQEFHGEEYSEDPDEVEPQHLAPSDAMLFHQVLADCAPEAHDGSELFEFTVTWTDPVTRTAQVDTLTMSMDEMLGAAGSQLAKADVVVAYAQALVDVWDLDEAEWGPYLDHVIATAEQAYVDTGDADLHEIAALLTDYRETHVHD